MKHVATFEFKNEKAEFKDDLAFPFYTWDGFHKQVCALRPTVSVLCLLLGTFFVVELQGVCTGE